MSDGVSKNKKSNNGNAIPALIDETDTMPVNNNTTRKTPKQQRVRRGCKARSTPKKLATPLPPLNPAKTG